MDCTEGHWNDFLLCELYYYNFVLRRRVSQYEYMINVELYTDALTIMVKVFFPNVLVNPVH